MPCRFIGSSFWGSVNLASHTFIQTGSLARTTDGLLWYCSTFQSCFCHIAECNCLFKAWKLTLSAAAEKNRRYHCNDNITAYNYTLCMFDCLKGYVLWRNTLASRIKRALLLSVEKPRNTAHSFISLCQVLKMQYGTFQPKSLVFWTDFMAQWPLLCTFLDLSLPSRILRLRNWSNVFIQDAVLSCSRVLLHPSHQTLPNGYKDTGRVDCVHPAWFSKETHYQRTRGKESVKEIR